MIGRQGWGVAVVLVLSVGCAGQRKAVRAPSAAEAPAARAPEVSRAKVLEVSVAPGPERRYVDPELGFEICRPSSAWELEASDEETAEGLVIPVVLRHRESGAQVVLQVAPAVATPVQLAERLTHGLRSHPGVTTTEPEPLSNADGAVGFRFAMGDRLLGRVAVMDGRKGQVWMIMATWPSGAPDGISSNVDEIFGSLRAIPQQ